MRLHEITNAVEPTIVADDGDVAHAKMAQFDDDAYIRYWITRRKQIVVQTMHSSQAVRGRAMLAWLKSRYRRSIFVVEVTHEASGFWDKMEQEGLIQGYEYADGNPHRLEKSAIAFPD